MSSQQIVRSFDGKLRTTESGTATLMAWKEVSEKKSAIYSQFLYNVCFNKHFLFQISDTNVADIDPEIRAFLRKVIEDEAKPKITAQFALAILQALSPKSRPHSGPKKTRFLQEAYDLKERKPFALSEHVTCIEGTTKERDAAHAGIEHTMSYRSNLMNWYNEVDKWKQNRRDWLASSQYMMALPQILQVEQFIKTMSSDFYRPLTLSWCEKPEVKAFIQSQRLFRVTKEAVENHRYYEWKYKNPKRRPSFNPKCRDVFIPDLMIRNRHQHDVSHETSKYSADICINNINIPCTLWTRPMPVGAKSGGISLRDMDANGDILVRAIVKTDIVKAITGDFTTTAYVDRSWAIGRKVVILMNGNKHFIDLYDAPNNFNQLETYSQFRRNKKRIPTNLKQYRQRWSDHATQLAMSKLVLYCKKIGATRIVIEKVGGRNRLPYAPDTGRRNERRTNLLASSVRLVASQDWLKHACKIHGIALSDISNWDKSGKVYNPSRTCIKCNSLGARFYKSGNTYRVSSTGKIFCCLNGHIESNSDILAVKNMARREHPDKTKRPALFKKGERLTESQISKCVEYLSQNSQSLASAVAD